MLVFTEAPTVGTSWASISKALDLTGSPGAFRGAQPGSVCSAVFSNRCCCQVHGLRISPKAAGWHDIMSTLITAKLMLMTSYLAFQKTFANCRAKKLGPHKTEAPEAKAPKLDEQMARCINSSLLTSSLIHELADINGKFSGNTLDPYCS